MKIVNREEFLRLPKGTIFSYFTPNVFEGLMRKGRTRLNYIDFDFCNILCELDSDSTEEDDEICEEMQKGEQRPLHFDTWSRDAMFDDSQLFAIHSKEDIVGLMGTLLETLKEI